ncbi:protein JINGUBANG-like [Panicum virgatum]|uniref:protein JINGUBANG-like n=1 Tax=Panicum virgatum TaxID=38727 RepID=UPI0019D5E7DF|nr:protein JINGUBANG-like [Panicum virgatum]
MNFGRRRSFSSIEEDRTSSPGTRTPLHQYHARFTMSSVPMSGRCSPWAQSPLHGRHRFPPSPGAIYHCLAALHRLESDVHALAVARGVLFAASDSGRVRAWAAPECCDRGYLDVGRGRVQALAACGHTLVTSHGRGHNVRVWTVRAAATSEPHVRAKKAATLPANGRLSVLCFGKKRPPHHHRDTVSCLVLHAAAGLLYTASHDRTVKAWKLSDGACTDSFAAHDGPINAMVVNEADGCVFTGSSDGTVKIYFLYAGSSDGYVNVWDKKATVGRPVHAGYLKGHRLAVYCLASGGCGGRVVVSGSEDATMRVWRREGTGGGATHTCLAVIEGHRGPVRCLTVGDGEGSEVEGRGMVVYSAGLDKSVKVWRIRVVAKEEEEDDDDDDGEGGAQAEIMAGNADGDAIPARNDLEDSKKMEFVGPTPVPSPSWVVKRRHTSRG